MLIFLHFEGKFIFSSDALILQSQESNPFDYAKRPTFLSFLKSRSNACKYHKTKDVLT